MPDISSAANLFLVIIGFGALILVHELGHFLAARWAGVRVHEFAIGFGQAICSWRKGYGFTLGSSEQKYQEQLKAIGHSFPNGDLPGVSPTEYRLNWIPFGGYVRMLGQDDSDPTHTSTAPDSYATKPVAKRMIIISAGVVMNIITAALLFIAVFMSGLKQPAAVVGNVADGMPASLATPSEHGGSLAPGAGLRTGDRILSINGKQTPTFGYVQVATAMARAGATLRFEVEREGFDGPLRFDIAPEKSADARRGMQIGVGMGISNVVGQPLPGLTDELFEELDTMGLGGVEPGDVLTRVNDINIDSYHEFEEAIASSDGAPITLTFTSAASSETKQHTIEPVASGMFEIVDETRVVHHMLGLTPPVVVGSIDPASKNIDILRVGDIIARIGSIEWPSFAQLRDELEQHKGDSISIRVIRENAYTTLEATVSNKGQIGFTTRQLPETPAIVTSTLLADAGIESSAESIQLMPGSRIVSVDGTPVESFAELRTALVSSSAQGEGASFELGIRLPIGEEPSAGPVESASWEVEASAINELHALGWASPISPVLFEPETVILEASNPINALSMGLSETKRIITLSYLTLLRFVQGSVHIEQFKGPVGIAHIGTQIARDGFISLLFFLAVISTNLAVLNFLPLPIVDGGHMVYLMIEGVTGKPVSIVVQNLAAMAGILVLASFFLLVTFNDIRALLGA
ncbi:MAG: site-2 protease family protein [Planctomycetota bacterium]|jgi:regulator of sigma E protease